MHRRSRCWRRIAAGTAVGVAWDWRRWAPLAVLFFAIVMPLFTSGFTNPDGVRSALWGSLDYWIDQQAVQRGTQPGYYYLMMLPLYEFVLLAPALLGGAWLLWRGDRLTALLAWWFAGTLLALSSAGEKMPWLTVHMALPLALLAARSLGAALPAAAAALRRSGRPVARAGAVAGLVVGALLLALSLRTAGGVVYAHPDTPLEPLIYTQTSPDVPALAAEIERFAAAGPGREGLVVTVDTTTSFSWPWAWYLRDFPRASYAAAGGLAAQAADGGVVIAARSTLTAHPELRDRFPVQRPYRHRWWFPEQGYKETSFGALWDRLRGGSLLRDWLDFYAGGVAEATLGSIDGEVLFPTAPPVAPPARSRESP